MRPRSAASLPRARKDRPAKPRHRKRKPACPPPEKSTVGTCHFGCERRAMLIGPTGCLEPRHKVIKWLWEILAGFALDDQVSARGRGVACQLRDRLRACHRARVVVTVRVCARACVCVRVRVCARACVCHCTRRAGVRSAAWRYMAHGSDMLPCVDVQTSNSRRAPWYRRAQAGAAGQAGGRRRDGVRVALLPRDASSSLSPASRARRCLAFRARFPSPCFLNPCPRPH